MRRIEEDVRTKALNSLPVLQTEGRIRGWGWGVCVCVGGGVSDQFLTPSQPRRLYEGERERHEARSAWLQHKLLLCSRLEAIRLPFIRYRTCCLCMPAAGHQNMAQVKFVCNFSPRKTVSLSHPRILSYPTSEGNLFYHLILTWSSLKVIGQNDDDDDDDDDDYDYIAYIIIIKCIIVLLTGRRGRR